jgi:light-regulated signal transduction histidine kinase (bacteriophytochrome)
LEAANKELESFAYSVSHDLRAPLRAIDGFSLAILEDYSEVLDDKAEEYLTRVRKASQRMSQLIDDILVLSRLTLAGMEKKYFNLSVLVEEIYERLEHLRHGRNIDLKVVPGLVINADQRLISIALENLINNAIKFTQKKESAIIEFGVQNESGVWEFFIRDNGEGFDMKYYDKLFGAFQRLHNPEEFPGTGIGLATVKRIIHRHGGNIRAQSMQGDGATFYFSIPE